MQDGSDFSLPIVVVLPERKVVVADDRAATTPFIRAPLPGIDPRPTRARAEAAPPRAEAAPPRAEAAPRADAPPLRAEAAPRTAAVPLPAPRHAWLSSATRAAVPSRIKARHLAAVPPPPSHATPLSDEDEKRMQRRMRAYRRQAWAQRMLERFQFEA